MNVSTQQSPLLHLDVLYRGLSFTWVCLHYRNLCFTWTCSTGAWASPGLVYTTGSFASPGCALQGPELHPGSSTPQSPVLHLDVLYMGLSFTWACLFASPGRVLQGAWAPPGLVYTTESFASPGCALQGPELHLSLSTLQSPVLHLDMTTSFSLQTCQASDQFWLLNFNPAKFRNNPVFSWISFWCCCGDYRRLNNVTIPDIYPQLNMMNFSSKGATRK
jgi:hypothetical protein